MEKGQLIAVTGANGYIGSHVVKQLLLRGYRVRAIVRDPSNNAKVGHLKTLSPQDHLEFAKGELNEEDYKRAFVDCHAVLHVASPYFYSASDPDRDIVQPAIAGTKAALNAAVANKIKRVVVTSSSAAVTHFPVPDGYVFTEKDWNLQGTLTNGPYMLSKRLAEEAAWEFASAHPEIELAVVNPVLVLGPTISGEHINTSLSNLKKLLLGEPGPVTLTMYRAIVDVRDVATAHIIALEHPKAVGRRLFCANKFVSWAEMATVCKRLFPQYPNTPPVDVPPPTCALDTKPLAELGLDKYIGLDQMVKECVESMVEQGGLPKL